jgi:hypothetical protein
MKIQQRVLESQLMQLAACLVSTEISELVQWFITKYKSHKSEPAKTPHFFRSDYLMRLFNKRLYCDLRGVAISLGRPNNNLSRKPLTCIALLPHLYSLAAAKSAPHFHALRLTTRHAKLSLARKLGVE